MNGHGWPATVFILGTFAGGSYRSPPLSGEHYGGNGELTLICNKFCVFSDLLSVDYGGLVATLPDPSVASGIAIRWALQPMRPIGAKTDAQNGHRKTSAARVDE